MPSGSIDTIELMRIENHLGFNLLREYLLHQGTFPQEMTNTVLSPISVCPSLLMVFNGADGDTRESIAETLALPRIDPNSINEKLRESIEALNNIQGLEIAIANSLWVKKEISLSEDFRVTCEKYYSAQTSSLDFSSPEALKTINDWVNDATKGNIPDIVEKISPSTILYIINAVFFKGIWAKQFNPQNTKTGIFHSLGNDEVQCQFMNQSGSFSYLKTEYFTAARLPYQDERFSMIVFLPTPHASIEESTSTFQANLNPENWYTWLDQFHVMEGNLSMPRIEIDCAMDLKETLVALGMGKAFDQSNANFNHMVDTPANIFISDIKHKTRLEVNEEGTVAAAATKVTMMSKSLAMRFSMILDRPFFFVIHDNESGGLLFMGWIINPGSNLTE